VFELGGLVGRVGWVDWLGGVVGWIGWVGWSGALVGWIKHKVCLRGEST
jgi:hypothetical protein